MLLVRCLGSTNEGGDADYSLEYWIMNPSCKVWIVDCEDFLLILPCNKCINIVSQCLVAGLRLSMVRLGELVFPETVRAPNPCRFCYTPVPQGQQPVKIGQVWTMVASMVKIITTMSRNSLRTVWLHMSPPLSRLHDCTSWSHSPSSAFEDLPARGYRFSHMPLTTQCCDV